MLPYCLWGALMMLTAPLAVKGQLGAVSAFTRHYNKAHQPKQALAASVHRLFGSREAATMMAAGAAIKKQRAAEHKLKLHNQRRLAIHAVYKGISGGAPRSGWWPVSYTTHAGTMRAATRPEGAWRVARFLGLAPPRSAPGRRI